MKVGPVSRLHRPQRTPLACTLTVSVVAVPARIVDEMGGSPGHFFSVQSQGRCRTLSRLIGGRSSFWLHPGRTLGCNSRRCDLASEGGEQLGHVLVTTYTSNTRSVSSRPAATQGHFNELDCIKVTVAAGGGSALVCEGPSALLGYRRLPYDP